MDTVQEASSLQALLAEYTTHNYTSTHSSDQDVLCFCCEGDSAKRRHKRAITVSDPNHSRILLQRYNDVAKSIDCTNQEPIRVHLTAAAIASSGKKPRGRSRSENHKNHASAAASVEKSYYVSRPQNATTLLETFKKGKALAPSPSPLVQQQYYDPSKLSYVFTTPSTLRKRFIKDRENRGMESYSSNRVSPPRERNE